MKYWSRVSEPNTDLDVVSVTPFTMGNRSSCSSTVASIFSNWLQFWSRRTLTVLKHQNDTITNKLTDQSGIEPTTLMFCKLNFFYLWHLVENKHLFSTRLHDRNESCCFDRLVSLDPNWRLEVREDPEDQQDVVQLHAGLTVDQYQSVYLSGIFVSTRLGSKSLIWSFSSGCRGSDGEAGSVEGESGDRSVHGPVTEGTQRDIKEL